MKTIGLIGGMSWESSIEYYRIINEQMKARLGGLHSAKSLMYSVDFAEVEQLQHQGKWKDATKLLVSAAKILEKGGADFFVICTNTMHMMAEEIQDNVQIPLLHIADTTAEKIQKSGFKKVGLLGTNFTMEEGFYRARLAKRYGLDVCIPEENDRKVIHETIYKELCRGNMNVNSRKKLIKIVESLAEQGTEAVILACTELPLLLKEGDTKLPLFDTTKIHAQAAVKYSLGQFT